MEVSLFSGLRIQAVGGAQIRLQTDKIRALFAYLAMHANQPIMREQLATLFWGDLPDATAKRNLRLSFSRIKKAFEAHGGTALIVANHQQATFVLRTDVSIDAVACEALWLQCKAIERDSWTTNSAVIKALQAMAQQYQGDFLAGLSPKGCIEFDAWVAVQREHYHQRMLLALEVLAEHFIGRGEYDSAETYAQQALSLEAWHEPAHRQLITLYRLSNRASAARKQFEQCKLVLWEELGVEPNTATVAAQSLNPVATQPRTAPKARPKHNLSAEPNAFLGRETEVAQLQQLLTDGSTRLITLHGEGGIGKTRLARAVGMTLTTTFIDGVYFIPLVSVTTLNSVVSTITKTLAVQLSGRKAPVEQLHAALSQRRMLLIVDNLEHLVDDDGEVIDLLLELLDAAPQLVLLVTSRQKLWVRAETVMRLSGLPFPEKTTDEAWQQTPAAQLFITRMQQHDTHFDPASHRESIGQICKAVQGLPLGLELAAAQASLRSCAIVADELGQTLSLRTRMRDVPKRQRSLSNVFDYSARLLKAQDRSNDTETNHILARCAVMRGDFDLEAFHVITRGTRDDLETLLTHALVRQAGGRYDMHELVRQNAIAQLDAAERKRIQNAHMNFFLGVVAGYRDSFFYEIETVVTHLRREWAHIEQAWAWAVEADSAELIGDTLSVLSSFWIVGGITASARPMLTAAIDHFKRKWFFDRSANALVDQLLAVRIELDLKIHNDKEANQTIENVLMSWRSVHPNLQFTAVFVVGIYYAHSDQPSKAFEFFDELWNDKEVRDNAFAYFHVGAERMKFLANMQRLEEAQAVHDALEPLLIRGQADVWAIYQRGWMQVFTWRLSAGLDNCQHHYDWVSRLRGGRVVDDTLRMHTMALYRLGYFRQAIATVIEGDDADAANFTDIYSVSALTLVTRACRRLGEVDRALHFGRIAYEFDIAEQAASEEGRGSDSLPTCVAYCLALCATGQPLEAQKLLAGIRSDMNRSELTINWYTLVEGTLAHCYAEAGQWHAAYEMVDGLYGALIAADVVYMHLEQTWFCYQILQRYADPRADDLLQHARNVLDARINRLAPEHRERFVSSFPEHREILRLTDQLVTDPTEIPVMPPIPPRI